MGRWTGGHDALVAAGPSAAQLTNVDDRPMLPAVSVASQQSTWSYNGGVRLWLSRVCARYAAWNGSKRERREQKWPKSRAEAPEQADRR